MAIANEQLIGNGFTTVLSVPSGKTYAITNILVCNNGSTGTADFDMHFVPQGEPASNYDTRVINNLTLPAGETFTFDNEKIVLDEGDSIRFFADPIASFPTVDATTMKDGKTYEIVTTGTTDFTAHGAASNTPGTIFTMTNAPATGSGEVTLSGYTNFAVTVSYLEV
jgi:hypothetical protein